MAYVVCPYFKELSNACDLFKSKQEDYQKQKYCLSRDNWLKCPNYQKDKQNKHK